MLVGCSGGVELRLTELSENNLAYTIDVLADDPVTAHGACIADDDPSDVRILDPVGPDTYLSIPVWGLRADTPWTCSVDVEKGRTHTHKIRIEPDGLPIGVGGFTVEGETDGWTWLTAWNHGRNHPNTRLTLVDERGRVRAYHYTEHPTVAGLDATPDGDLLLVGGGPDLAPTWLNHLGQITRQHGEPPWPGAYHHHAEPVDGGVLTLVELDATDGQATWLGFGVVWFDETGAVGWQWNAQDAVDAGTLEAAPAESDPWHANSAAWFTDDLGPAVWVSLATLNQIVRIDRDTGALTHHLGEGGDFTLLDAQGQPSDDWFAGQHDPEWVWPEVLIHDNGVDQSRALRLDVDLLGGTAQATWSWTEPDWHELIFGDADRVNDGVLITRGRCFDSCVGMDESRLSQVVELDANDNVMWRLIAPDNTRGFYRAERVPTGD